MWSCVDTSRNRLGMDETLTSRSHAQLGYRVRAYFTRISIRLSDDHAGATAPMDWVGPPGLDACLRAGLFRYELESFSILSFSYCIDILPRRTRWHFSLFDSL